MKNPPQTSPAYQFDDVSIDRDNFQVRKRGELVALTPRAFDVLTYLIEKRARVVEKQELFEQVWKETFVTDNALTRTVKEIRRNLGDNAGAPRYIETIHKRGYRFIGDLKDSHEVAEAKGIGLEPTEKPVSLPTPSSRSVKIWRYRMVIGLTAGALLAVAAIIYFSTRHEKQIRSLAVLPLENASTDPNAEYLSDGIAESLINRLSQLPQLKVMPRTTAFRYKRQPIEPQRVGRELGVDAVLTGKVIQQGEDLTIQAEITYTSDGSQLWGQRYYRKLSDIFSLQEQISMEISEKLGLRLTGDEERILTRRYTENAAAYELFLKGRYHLNKLTPPDVQTSVSYFQQAISLDPLYALAFVGLADGHRVQALSLGLPATEYFPKSKAAAQRATEIDDRLGEARALLGFAILFYDRDWSEAERQFKRALDLNPNSSDTHMAYAGLLVVTGRFNEALAETKQAREIDPLNFRAAALEGQFLILAGQSDEGLARLMKIIELESNFFPAHLFASNGYIEKQMYTEAIAAASRARDLSGGSSEAIATIAYALALSGKRAEANAALNELKKRSVERYVPPYDLATAHHALAEREETFAMLERGLEQRDPKMIFLKFDPKWTSLRDDPRFKGLLRQVGFPE